MSWPKRRKALSADTPAAFFRIGSMYEHPGHRADAHSMAITGTVAWIVRENLPEWQAALRSQADRFAATRLQTDSPPLQTCETLPTASPAFFTFVCFQ